jgi:hypothetical protein
MTQLCSASVEMPTGAQFLLTDGSARFISENIERNIDGVAGDFVHQ